MSPIDALLVMLLGALVGSTELVSRYRDAPLKAVFSFPGLVYLAINALAGLAALGFLGFFGPPDDTDAQLHVTRILVAGLGSAALFRASFFTVRHGDKDISVGPNTVLRALLKATDSAVDRNRAVLRLRSNVMDGVSFLRQHDALISLCAQALQNPDAEDAKKLGALSGTLRARSGVSDRIKAELLGLELMTLVGRPALQAAVSKLRTIEKASIPSSAPASEGANAVQPTPPVSGAPPRDELLQRLSELSVRSPEVAETYLELAGLREKLDDGDGAIRDLDEALRLKPDFAEARLARGRLRDHPLGSQQAETDFQWVAEQPGVGDPVRSEALYELGRMLMRRGAFAAALRHLSQAIGIADAAGTLNRDALLGRACCFIQLGGRREALDDLNRAVETGSSDVHVRVLRGFLLEELGQTELALQDFWRAAIDEREALSSARSNAEMFGEPFGLKEVARGLMSSLVPSHPNRSIASLHRPKPDLGPPPDTGFPHP